MGLLLSSFPHIYDNLAFIGQFNWWRRRNRHRAALQILREDYATLRMDRENHRQTQPGINDRAVILDKHHKWHIALIEFDRQLDNIREQIGKFLNYLMMFNFCFSWTGRTPAEWVASVHFRMKSLSIVHLLMFPSLSTCRRLVCTKSGLLNLWSRLGLKVLLLSRKKKKLFQIWTLSSVW